MQLIRLIAMLVFVGLAFVTADKYAHEEGIIVGLLAVGVYGAIFYGLFFHLWTSRTSDDENKTEIFKREPKENQSSSEQTKPKIYKNKEEKFIAGLKAADDASKWLFERTMEDMNSSFARFLFEKPDYFSDIYINRVQDINDTENLFKIFSQKDFVSMSRYRWNIMMFASHCLSKLFFHDPELFIFKTIESNGEYIKKEFAYYFLADKLVPNVDHIHSIKILELNEPAFRGVLVYLPMHELSTFNSDNTKILTPYFISFIKREEKYECYLLKRHLGETNLSRVVEVGNDLTEIKYDTIKPTVENFILELNFLN